MFKYYISPLSLMLICWKFFENHLMCKKQWNWYHRLLEDS